MKKSLRRLFSIIMFHVLPLKRSLTYLFSRHSDNHIIDVCDYRMHIDMKDTGISKDLYMRGIREIPLTDFFMMSGVLGEGDIILSIGANIGYYVIMFSKLIGDTGQIYAVEPIVSNYHLLEKNVKLNKCKNIKLYRLALGDYNGSGTIYVSSKRNWASMIRENTAELIGTENVEVMTVDSFLEDKKAPSLIRMDVEGYEYNILKGMTETLRKDVKITIEIHGSHLLESQLTETLLLLQQHGFHLFVIRSDFSPIKYFLIELQEKPRYYLSPITFENLKRELLANKSTLHIYLTKEVKP